MDDLLLQMEEYFIEGEYKSGSFELGSCSSINVTLFVDGAILVNNIITNFYFEILISQSNHQ